MCTEIEVSSEKDGFMKCKECPIRFLTKIGLKVHSRIEHKKDKETKLDQLQDSPTFENEIAFDENAEIEEKCPFCKLCFENKIYLQMHISNEHNKLTQRNKGKKLHIFKANVKKNIPKSNDLLSTVCQECKKSFVKRSTLQKHINNVHKKLTPFQCQECKKYFGQKPHLQRHITNVHKKLTPFQCLECKKHFGQKPHLQIHIDNVHKKLKPFQCQECNQSFGQKSSLKFHTNIIHLKKTSFQCQKCKKYFGQNSNLRTHILSVHENMYSNHPNTGHPNIGFI